MTTKLKALLFLGLSAVGAQAATMTMTNALGGVSNGTNFVIGTVGFGQPANNWPGAETPAMAIDGSFGPGGRRIDVMAGADVGNGGHLNTRSLTGTPGFPVHPSGNRLQRV